MLKLLLPCEVIKVQKMNRLIKTYSELIQLPTFEERFQYLKLDGVVGEDTFGSKRWLNQVLYRSSEWKRFKDKMIVRDYGCDLALSGYDIYDTIYLHHLNPITEVDVVNRSSVLMDPENVVCTRLSTHNAIHYGDASLLMLSYTERTPFDTCPWRKQ